MAIGRLSVVVGARGKASPHAEYIAREGKYEKDESIEKLEATGHGNMPQWAEHEPNFFWKMSDNYERKNGTSYREHVISLPRELTVDQRHELIKEWIKQEIGDRHAYQYAIHNPPALDGGEQPHAHIMFSERLRDGIDRDPDSYFKRYNSKNPESGGSKKANTPKLAAERKLELKQQRDRWEKMCNTHLELAGSDAKISMKSLKAQNIKREPTNFTMSEIQDETIRKSYIDTLEAKKEVLSVIPSQDALVKEIKTQQDLKTDEFTQSLKDDYELERIELLVDEHYKQQEVQAEQERKALLAAQQKAVQAEQERKALLAAQQKAAQAEQERKAIQGRTPFDLVNIRMKSIVRPRAFGREIESLSGDIPIGEIMIDVIKAHKNGYSADLTEGNNSHLYGNDTAQSIKRFMLKNIYSYDVVYDYCNLSTKEFTEKHDLKFDLDDLQKLNDANPPTPVIEPMRDTRVNAALNAEPKPQTDSSYDNSPGF